MHANPSAPATACDTAALATHDRDIVSLFAEMVEHSPHSIALESADKRLSYRQLNNRANQVARYLVDSGAARYPFIGVCLERSFEMVVAALGVVKAGAAYLPVDPVFPSVRIQYMLKEAGVPLTLSNTTMAPQVWEHLFRPVSMSDAEITEKDDTDLLLEISPRSPAYVMYTSGTTGQPKGVAIPHAGLVRLVRDTNYLQVNPSDVLLHHSTCSFDAGIFEIWAALLNGAKLALYPPQPFNLDMLYDTIIEHGITTLLLTTSLFHLVAEHKPECLGPLRQIVIGGDVLQAKVAKAVLARFPHLTLINGYGPTENAVFTCCYVINHEIQIGESVPIGTAISGTNGFVLDEQMQKAELGQVGELYTNGLGLAGGYLNRDDLTRERFVPSPFPEYGSLLYKTGDLVREKPAGLLHFVGRADGQVKIRGFRVEPSEIEHLLNLMPEVEESAVLAEGEVSAKYLVAYLKPSACCVALDARLVRQHLADRLPAFMVPTHIHIIPEFPMTLNGKLDKKRLPTLVANPQTSNVTQNGDAGDWREMVLNVWRKRLQAPELGENDSIYDHGASSLTAIVVHSELSRHFSCSIDPRELVHAKTPIEWAGAYERRRKQNLKPVTLGKTNVKKEDI